MPPAPKRSCCSTRPQLSVEARAEAGQRVAFVYYVLGLDLDARRVADTWRQGATGEWASQAAWISGLASWRLGDCERRLARLPAGRRARPAARASRRRLLLGGARRAGRRPPALGRALLAAAHAAESAGKLLRPARPRNARHADASSPADPFIGFDPPVDQLPNVQRAIELARIGEPALAEEMLRHQAKIGLADRASCADPARQAARPCRPRSCGSPTTASRARAPTPPTAIPTRAGARSTAGGSIPRSPSAISSRNRRSAAPRSAPPARSA